MSAGYLVAILVVMGGSIIAYAASRGWIGNVPPWRKLAPPAKPKPEPEAKPEAKVIIDTTGRVHGASVIVNGHELNSVVSDITIRLPVDDIPRVDLEVVPLDGVHVLLRDAELITTLRRHPGPQAIAAAHTIREACKLISYDRPGRQATERLLTKLREISAALDDGRLLGVLDELEVNEP